MKAFPIPAVLLATLAPVLASQAAPPDGIVGARLSEVRRWPRYADAPTVDLDAGRPVARPAAPKPDNALSEREAISAAVLRFEDLIAHREKHKSTRLPESLEGYYVRRATAQPDAWFIEFLTDAEAANQAGGFAYELGVSGPEGRLGTWGTSTTDMRNPPKRPLRISADEVRKWPEFAVVQKRIAEHASRARATWNQARGDAARAVAALRPDLSPWMDKVEPFLDFCNGQTILAGVGQSADPAMLRFRFVVGRPPRPQLVMIQAARTGREPEDNDGDAWRAYAEETLSVVFGKKPEGTLTIRSYKDQLNRDDKIPRPDDRRAGPPQPWWIFTWTPSLRGATMPAHLGTSFTVYPGKERMDLRWEQTVAPDRLAALVRTLEDRAAKTDLATAVMAVAKSAEQAVPGTDPDKATVKSAGLEVVDTREWTWQQEKRQCLYLDGPLAETLEREWLAPFWTVRIAVGPYSEVLGRVDPASGKIVALVRLGTRPPVESR